MYRKVTVKRSCRYCECGSFEHLLFLLLVDRLVRVLMITRNG